jgi:hypothetical protein
MDFPEVADTLAPWIIDSHGAFLNYLESPFLIKSTKSSKLKRRNNVMKLKHLLSVNAIILLIFGIPLLVAADPSMKMYGITMSPEGLNVVRYFGHSLIFTGVLAWLFRNVEDARSQRAICIGYLIGCILGFGVALYNQLAVQMINLVWLTVALYLIFGLGYCYFLVSGKK